jgi:hypothetical protein
MSMAERIHAQAGHEIQIPFAFEVIEVDTLSALKAYRVAVVGGEKEVLFEIDDLFQLRHSYILERRERRRDCEDVDHEGTKVTKERLYARTGSILCLVSSLLPNCA